MSRACSSPAASSARIVSDAPAPLRGLRISGKPTCSAKASASAALTHRGRGGCRYPRLAQCLLHRRLVPAQPRCPDRRARDTAGLPHPRCGQGVRLDRRLDPVDPQPVLHAAHLPGHRLGIGDRRHLLVVVQPALQLLVERLRGRLAQTYHRRAGLCQRAGEVTLAGGEERLDEDDVHARHVSPRGQTAPFPQQADCDLTLRVSPRRGGRRLCRAVSARRDGEVRRGRGQAAGMELAVITCEQRPPVRASFARPGGTGGSTMRSTPGRSAPPVQAVGGHLDRYNGSWRCSSSCQVPGRAVPVAARHRGHRCSDSPQLP